MRGPIVQAWELSRESISAFISDNALSRGAAMAFYAATSLAPILLIVIAIAGAVFGHDAAQLALSAQISGLMGPQTAELLQVALETASNRTAGTWATVIGLVTLFVTASGVFGEMQAALNAIWKVKPTGSSVSRLVRARAVSLGLVAALGFLLLVSLIASAAISAMRDVINAHLPFGTTILGMINMAVSFVLISAMFAAIYKVLPDRTLTWRDVIVGALVTAALFSIGKSLIAWYLGSSAIASSYGSAGGLLVFLLWVYYSSQIFLFGAEVTRAYSIRHGSRSDLAAVVDCASPIDSAPTRRIPASYGRGLAMLSLITLAWSAIVAAQRPRRPS